MVRRLRSAKEDELGMGYVFEKGEQNENEMNTTIEEREK
jgi:hypothetical protein